MVMHFSQGREGRLLHCTPEDMSVEFTGFGHSFLALWAKTVYFNDNKQL